MKYCLFDGGDVVGPFLAEELLAREGFDRHSLVCPEEYSEEESYWKEAYLYPDFGFAASEQTSEVQVKPSLEEDQNISSLLMRATKNTETNPNAGSAAAPAAVQPEENKPVAASEEEALVQLVPTAPSPIEEYFNSIRSGDLGNILGIPDPKANSDANLAKALENQFEKTDPNADMGADKEPQEDPFDSFVKPAMDEADTLQTANPSLDEKDLVTRNKLGKKQSGTTTQKLDVDALLREADSSFAAEPQSLKAQEINEQAANEAPDMVVPLQEDDPEDSTIRTILEGRVDVKAASKEVPEPIKRVSAKTQPPVSALEQGKVIKHEEPQPRRRSFKGAWLLLGVLALIGGLLLNVNWKERTADTADTEKEQPVAQEPTQNESIALQLLPEDVPVEKPAAAPVPPAPKTPEEQAKEIVQKHVLSQGRGTVADYLARQYAPQLASGYTEAWSAEPLHRNVYVVKYRLAKTRQEPIVYVFQADISKNKLTGALNNITLDLVGKIK